MEIPANYLAIVEEVVTKAIKYGEKGRAPAPTLLKGGVYSGADQLNREIFKRLNAQPENLFNLKFLRLRLSDMFLSNEIQRELNSMARIGRKTTIFFMDGVDRILSLPTKKIKRGKKMGRGANSSLIVDEAHKLRKILLENSNKISLISTSSLSPTFMEDPDLPFYKFFNEITISPLAPEDTAKYFFSILKKNTLLDFKSPIISELGEIAFDWPYKLSGGNLLLIQKFNQVLSMVGKNSNLYSGKNKTKHILDEYFSQLQPILLMEIEGYGRDERRFIERAAMLSSTFSLKDVAFEQGNPTSIATKLVIKKILVKSGKGTYTFNHIPLRTLLRYFGNIPPTDAFSENTIPRGIES